MSIQPIAYTCCGDTYIVDTGGKVFFYLENYKTFKPSTFFRNEHALLQDNAERLSNGLYIIDMFNDWKMHSEGMKDEANHDQDYKD